MSFESRSTRFVVWAWLLVAAGTVLMTLRYGEMPEAVPAYRDLAGHATLLVPKGVATVFRVAAMGAGQLGAITTLLVRAKVAESRGWQKLFASGSLAAGFKTFVECAQFAAMGRPAVGLPPLLWLALTLLPVLVFLVAALYLWRTQQLSSARPLSFTPRASLAVSVSLLLWLGSAVFPKWL